MSEQTSLTRSPPATLHHWLFLLPLYIAAIPSVMTPSSGVAVVFHFALGWWAIHDSIARGHPIPLLSRGWFIVFPGILVPLYVIWSRGWRGAALMLGHLVAWYLLCFLILIVMIVAHTAWFAVH